MKLYLVSSQIFCCVLNLQEQVYFLSSQLEPNMEKLQVLWITIEEQTADNCRSDAAHSGAEYISVGEKKCAKPRNTKVQV